MGEGVESTDAQFPDLVSSALRFFSGKETACQSTAT
jgi:hypothetical protein